MIEHLNETTINSTKDFCRCRQDTTIFMRKDISLKGKDIIEK